MRILISGAGIAGPTLAYYLAKTGRHQITVVEKATTFLAQGQNIDITGSAITAVRKMGLLDEIRRFNTTETGTQLVDAKGKPFASFPVQEGTMSMTSAYEILRGDLAMVLYGATKSHPNVTYRFNTTINRILSNTEQAVSVQLSDGTEQSYDILVAADGQWSKLRQQTFDPADPADTIEVKDLGMFCAYWTVAREAADNDMWNIHISPSSRNITIRPDPHGTMRAMLTLMPCNVEQKAEWTAASRAGREAQMALVKREFGQAGFVAPRILAAMGQAGDFYFQNLQQIRMNRWSKGRVVCLGDAAWAPTPLTGAGATLAISGAYVLAGEISKLGPEQRVGDAFEAFEKVFKPFVQKMQRTPEIVPPRIAHPNSRVHYWVFRTLIALVARVVQWPMFQGEQNGSSEANDDGFPLPAYPSLDVDLNEKHGD